MARDKATDAAEPIDVEGLPSLTTNQQAYVNARLEGLNQTESYAKAYPNQNMSRAALQVEACRAEAHPKISLWLKAAQEAALETHVATLNEHTGQLARLREMALRSGNYGAAVNAEVNRGKVAGLYVDRVEDVTKATGADLGNFALQVADELFEGDIAKAHAFLGMNVTESAGNA